MEGWDQVAPVSVDKVGVYFRLAKPQTHQVSTIVSDILLWFLYLEIIGTLNLKNATIVMTKV